MDGSDRTHSKSPKTAASTGGTGGGCGERVVIDNRASAATDWGKAKVEGTRSHIHPRQLLLCEKERSLFNDLIVPFWIVFSMLPH
jgi:hypothetical protein